MGMFRKGFDVSREERKKQETIRENLGRRLFNFFLSKDGDEADIVFLTSEPVNYQVHNVQEGGKFKFYTCTQDDNCPFCNDGDNSSYRGAFLIIDKRPYEYTDKNGNKKVNDKGSIKFFSQGVRVISQLDRINTKYGLARREITMVRLGSGTQTTYTLERGDKQEIDENTIRDLLPDKLKDDFDGTEESLYSIVEEQIKMGVKGYIPSDSSKNSSNDEDEDYDARSNVISDDEDEKPKAKKKSLFKKPVNSVKKVSKPKSLFKNKEEQ